jgi:ATP-binding cassette subfamily B protein
MDLELEKDQGTIKFTVQHTGDIRIETVGFKHTGRAAILHDVSVILPAGKISLLVGQSGCGKSTLLALLQRLYQPESGRIFIGKHDIQYYRLTDLRRHLAVVPQQTQLLSGTVLENLAPGDYQPDMARLIQLCREVSILDFIEKLPQGFFTHLSENGTNLSGGQRQKLAIVRALYLNAPILLLDEPTSALDAKAEEQLMRLLGKLRDEGRTIIIAAHTSTLLSMADVIVTMASGSVISIQPDRALSTHESHSPQEIEGVTQAAVA